MTLLKSNYDTIVGLFFRAKKQLIISMPNITVEIAEAIISIYRKGVKVHLFIEFTEESYRAGYGDIRAIEKLKDAGISFCNKSGINIYFIIADDDGYFYFPKSLFFEVEGTTFDLFPMERLQVKTLKVIFRLHDEDDFQTDDIIEKVGIETLSEVSKGIESVDLNSSEIIINRIKLNPVHKPEVGRLMKVYTEKFKIVELIFKGANLHIKRVKLPKNALPFKDDDLKRSIEANLRLFKDIPEKEFFKPFFDLKLEFEKTRHDLLLYIKSREKSIIKVDDLDKLSKSIDELKDTIISVKTEMQNVLQKEIKNSRDAVKKSLNDFLLANPPNEFEGLTGDEFKNEVENAVSNIVSRIKFPSSKKLLEELKITKRIYNLTWEDLNDEDVLREMREKKFLHENDLAVITKTAFEVESLNNQSR